MRAYLGISPGATIATIADCGRSDGAGIVQVFSKCDGNWDSILCKSPKSRVVFSCGASWVKKRLQSYDVKSASVCESKMSRTCVTFRSLTHIL